MPILAPLFFVAFIMTGSMVFLNLLVGVMVNSTSQIPGIESADGSPLSTIQTPEFEGEHAPLIVERLARIETALAETTEVQYRLSKLREKK